jgi:FYVE zinc finger
VLEHGQKELQKAHQQFLIFQSREQHIASVKRKIARHVHELDLTPRDHRMLAIVGLSEDQAHELSGVITMAMKAIEQNEATIKQIDQSISGGVIVPSVKAAYVGTQAAIRFDAFMKKVKNELQQHRYDVTWKSKADERACANCCVVFKSATLRKTLAKHHCYLCGEVVCHPCSATYLFFEQYQDFKRVCRGCILEGGAELLARKVNIKKKLQQAEFHIEHNHQVLQRPEPHETRQSMFSERAHDAVLLPKGKCPSAPPRRLICART